MAVTINFYIFPKRHNSTAQPAIEPSATYQCNLIEPCGIINPRIVISESNINPSGANYAYIPLFSRYYYVTEWEYDHGLWTASLNVDVLATYKLNIGSSSQYILRSSATSDGNVTDEYYPTKNIELTTQTVPSIWDNYSMAGGGYILGIANNDSSGVGAVGYYYFTNSQLRGFLNEIMSSVDWTDIEPEEIAENVLKVQFNPIQYIVSAMWVPSTPSLGASLSSIPFGWWSIDGSCSRLADPIYNKTVMLSIPKHPNADSRGNYLNGSPFSRYTLHAAPFGDIPLDSNMLRNYDQVGLDIVLDCISGQAILTVLVYDGGSSSHIVKTVRATAGVPIQLAQVLRDDIQALGTTLTVANKTVGSGLMGFLTGGPTGAVTGALGGAINAVGDVISAAMPQLQTQGSNGSFAEYQTFSNLTCEFYIPVDDDNNNIGRPLCAVRTISTIPGYIMVKNADVLTPGTETENAEIENYMNGGFYYE